MGPAADPWGGAVLSRAKQEQGKKKGRSQKCSWRPRPEDVITLKPQAEPFHFLLYFEAVGWWLVVAVES